jgi:hypothetical protein
MFFISWFVFYGINFAYWTRNYGIRAEYYDDMSISLFTGFLAALIWPIGWMIEISFLGYGFKLK